MMKIVMRQLQLKGPIAKNWGHLKVTSITPVQEAYQRDILLLLCRSLDLVRKTVCLRQLLLTFN